MLSSSSRSMRSGDELKYSYGVDYVPLKSEPVSVLHYLQAVLTQIFLHTLIKYIID